MSKPGKPSGNQIPARASERLQLLRGQGGVRPLFTSDLSGQDFRTLLAAGYRPVQLVMGTCVYYVGIQGLRQWFSSTMGQNVEMTNYTQAMCQIPHG